MTIDLSPEAVAIGRKAAAANLAANEWVVVASPEQVAKLKEAGLVDELRDPQGRWVDTIQQKAILRQNKQARKVREMYPQGTRVRASATDTGPHGTVYRHVPGSNAQGGSVTVDWDNDSRGRHSPISIQKVTEDDSAQQIVSALEKGQHSTASAAELHDIVTSLESNTTPVNLEDLHVTDMGHGNLFDHSATDIRRADMPQVPLTNAAEVKAFTDLLATHGYTYTLEQHKASDLIATQNELDGRVVGKIAAHWNPKKAGALITSKDLDILDGHHRWAAGVVMESQDPNYTVPVLRINASIGDLLEVAYAYDKAHRIKDKVMGQA